MVRGHDQQASSFCLYRSSLFVFPCYWTLLGIGTPAECAEVFLGKDYLDTMAGQNNREDQKV
jgi:hypothetical protein